MHRPGHFSAIDVAPFERHEAAIARLWSLTGKAFEAGFTALDDEARHLCAIPVHHLDLARNARLLSLSLVYYLGTFFANLPDGAYNTGKTERRGSRCLFAL